ncbi:acyloxyacyl hydrolase [Pontiellaceae bacterium B12227]|nr:acyloxyacyl hydrolase [Pontiellaceae bacterium B12227]
MNKAYLLLVLLVAGFSTQATENWYNQAFLGGGTSIKGFGATDQEVRTVDVVFRHARLFHEKSEGWIKGRHEFWMEVPVAIIVHDSDSVDDNDFGIVGLNFLAAWIFPESAIGSPYLMIGGGPQYVLADIEGVGSDLCGNYQLGCGTRFLMMQKHEINLEVRYHHISNLGMADPNVPLNSVKFYLGATLPF